MADPQSATPANCVAPAKPTAATEASDASPGQVETVTPGSFQSTPGKYGAQSVKTHSKNDDNKDKTHWIEILLVDDQDQPVPGESISVQCPDGSVANCSTDDQGLARVDYLDPGSCKITFINLDKDAVEAA